MKKALIAIGTITLLVGGSLVLAVLSPLGLLDAQEEGEAAQDPSSGAGRGRPHILEGALDELVAEGTITQEQADAVRDRVRSKFDEYRGEHPGRPGGLGRGASVEAAAESLGLTADEVKEALAGGSTLADLASRQGVEVQAVIDAIVADATARIEVAAANGVLDAERAEEIKAGLTDRVTAFVNDGRPAGDAPPTEEEGD
ncbi:MAG: hypothetical protein JJLCMIEE_01475 [Acidimicrobiales bacterium]|nr:hypothetical protein [Acidimicrobiales bacterium]RIK04778.1 MAG: hypothetical protein DCC48_12055 [Acidobacteriota bacterium]